MAEPDYKFKNAQIREALLECGGNLSESARYLTSKWNDSCTRAYVKRRVDATPELLALLEEIREEHIDHAEKNIFTAVKNGDYQASVLVVRTLGKERGWIPKEEVDNKYDADAVLEAIQKGRARAKGELTGDPNGQPSGEADEDR